MYEAPLFYMGAVSIRKSPESKSNFWIEWLLQGGCGVPGNAVDAMQSSRTHAFRRLALPLLDR